MAGVPALIYISRLMVTKVKPGSAAIYRKPDGLYVLVVLPNGKRAKLGLFDTRTLAERAIEEWRAGKREPEGDKRVDQLTALRSDRPLTDEEEAALTRKGYLKNGKITPRGRAARDET